MLLFFFHSSMSGMIERKEYKLADGQTELVFCTDSSGIQIKSIFNKKIVFERFFWMPIFNMIFYYKLSVIVIGVSILLINLYDFKWAVAFFPAYYIFWVGLEFFTEKTADVIFKKAFKLDDDKTEFYRFFEKEYIEKYYSNPGSKSFANVK